MSNTQGSDSQIIAALREEVAELKSIIEGMTSSYSRGTSEQRLIKAQGEQISKLNDQLGKMRAEYNLAQIKYLRLEQEKDEFYELNHALCNDETIRPLWEDLIIAIGLTYMVSFGE